jgi:dTDP-4-dehydrorhamnose reductase
MLQKQQVTLLKLNATAPENLAKDMKEVDAGGSCSTDYVLGGDPFNTPLRRPKRYSYRHLWSD